MSCRVKNDMVVSANVNERKGNQNWTGNNSAEHSKLSVPAKSREYHNCHIQQCDLHEKMPALSKQLCKEDVQVDSRQTSAGRNIPTNRKEKFLSQTRIGSLGIRVKMRWADMEAQVIATHPIVLAQKPETVCDACLVTNLARRNFMTDSSPRGPISNCQIYGTARLSASREEFWMLRCSLHVDFLKLSEVENYSSAPMVVFMRHHQPPPAT